ncbi:MAG: GYD domain-containing protein [Xanthobacteraceae bacterium]
MPTYIMLAQFTQQGITTIKNTAKRAEDFKLMASAYGVTVRAIFWTLGQYDVVVIVDAPDEMAMAALSMSAGTLGNARTQTLRAFSETEIKNVVDMMA